MRTDLSSQIKLDRIPRRYYAPESEIEAAALAREEKLDTRISETATDGAEAVADYIVKHINRYKSKKGKCVLALGAGVSTHRAYASLIEKCKQGLVSFKDVVEKYFT